MKISVWLLSLLIGPLPLSAASFSFTYTDPPDFGYNDTESASPVGANPGTSLGQQRRNLLEYAAETWAPFLQSDVTILIEANFDALGGSQFSATLAYASANSIHANFSGAPLPDTWYVSALADSLAGIDHNPGSNDLYVTVNASVDSSLVVMDGVGFYYGYDHQSGEQIDLLSVLLHELGHGLGFLTTVDASTGAYIGNFPDSFTVLMRDESTGLYWDEMNEAERLASATNDPNVVLTGTATQLASQRQLKPVSATGAVTLSITAPVSALASYAAKSSQFGLGLPSTGLIGEVILVDDGVAPASDACETPFLNADTIRGRIALLDRGTCDFTDKVKAAQNAGAIAAIVINNAGDTLVTMNGSDASIYIPSVFIAQSDGEAIKAALPGVILHLDNSGPLSGTQNGAVRLYAPDPVQPGSSLSHWSIDTYPELLMQPFIADIFLPDLDLTPIAFRDIGWKIQNTNLPYLNYATWAAEQISSPANAETEDADNDTWSNFAEYAFGANPMSSNDQPAHVSIVPSATTGAFHLFYVRNQAAADVRFQLSLSEDLLQAQTLMNRGIDYLYYGNLALGSDKEEIELNIESNSTRAFFQITPESTTP